MRYPVDRCFLPSSSTAHRWHHMFMDCAYTCLWGMFWTCVFPHSVMFLCFFFAGKHTLLFYEIQTCQKVNLTGILDIIQSNKMSVCRCGLCTNASGSLRSVSSTYAHIFICTHASHVSHTLYHDVGQKSHVEARIHPHASVRGHASRRLKSIK